MSEPYPWKLTKAQREAFEACCAEGAVIGPLSTMRALAARGLLEPAGFVLGRCLWRVPVHIHARWCEWCARNVKPEATG